MTGTPFWRLPDPLRGVAVDAAYIRGFVEQIEGPVLLVGHSYGGAVITVAGDAAQVVGLVYVAGFARRRRKFGRPASALSGFARGAQLPPSIDPR